MAFRADLTVEDKTYRVLYCSHNIHADTNTMGRISSRARFGKIDLEIEATDDIFFWSSVVMHGELFNGEIVFKKRDEDVKMKTLIFEDAQVIDHTETFHALGGDSMVIKLAISARVLTMQTNSEECEAVNEWPGFE